MKISEKLKNLPTFWVVIMVFGIALDVFFIRKLNQTIDLNKI